MTERPDLRGLAALADENTKGTCAIIVVDNQITTINVIDQPMYWYDNAWHPYAKNSIITIVEGGHDDRTS